MTKQLVCAVKQSHVQGSEGEPQSQLERQALQSNGQCQPWREVKKVATAGSLDNGSCSHNWWDIAEQAHTGPNST